jgi:hypothetical protein
MNVNRFLDSIMEPAWKEESAREVFVAWEKIRIVYNLILVFLVTFVFIERFSDRGFLRYLVECAIAANLCFCAGPVAEGYLNLLGVQRRLARLWLAILGFALSSALAYLAIGLWMFGKF